MSRIKVRRLFGKKHIRMKMLLRFEITNHKSFE